MYPSNTMISNRSARAYFIVNTSLIITGYAYYMALQTNFLLLMIFTAFRNYAMSKTVEMAVDHKAIINQNYEYPEGDYIYFMIQASLLESATTYCVSVKNTEPNTALVAVAFIPMSFGFFLVFDFFYYWTHRWLHTAHLSWHKTHHTHVHLKPSITFYQDFLDMLLTVSIPFLLAEKIVQIVYPLSYLEISLLLTYKIFIEISGHTGHISRPASSFSQCIWLPQILGIELYTEDHNLHHVDTRYNYGKQFSLWDKLFGTYKAAGNDVMVLI